MTSLFLLVTSATAQIKAHRRVELDFIQGREGIVLDDHPIAAKRRIDGENRLSKRTSEKSSLTMRSTSDGRSPARA